MSQSEEMAEDTAGIVHAVLVNRNDAAEFIDMMWICSGYWMRNVVEKFLVKGKVVTCALCLGTER